MSANFNFYLNRQGVKGRKGDQGDQGYSPTISVSTNTASEYKLLVQNEDYSFETPNLRGNAIENTGGTYIRFNPNTEAMYTGDLDTATSSRVGGVLITGEGILASGGDSSVPTSADVYDFVMDQIATSGLNFESLTNSLIAGDNITFDVDSTNETITINSTGSDLSNYVTLDTEQTLTAKKTSNITRSGSNMIYNVEFNGGNNANLRIGSTKGSSNSDNDIPVIIGNKLRIGTTESNLAPNFVCKSSSSLPSIGIFDITNTGVVTTDDTWHPIFSDLNVTFGSGLNVTTSGTGVSKKYTITATGGDLSNYVTLDTEQQITGRKVFRSPRMTQQSGEALAVISTSNPDGGGLGLGVCSPRSSTGPLDAGIIEGGELRFYYTNLNGGAFFITSHPSTMPSVVPNCSAPYDYIQPDKIYPLFNELNLLAGTGISITRTGTGTASMQKYTISATGSITVDSTLSLTSTNPVQNAVITQALNDINAVIPTQASTSNQLADKDFVNSSVSTNTANFIGTFNSLSDLENYSGTVTNNDYAFVVSTDSSGNTVYNRYKYNASTSLWMFEYALNNSSFTSGQWNAINSGITSNDVSLIGTALQPNDNISNLTNDTGYITSVDWGDINGTLTNQADLQSALNAKYDASNPNGYITGITSSDVTTALGYTPYDSTNPNGYTSNVGTVTSVNNTQPDANGNVTIPVDQTYNPTSSNAQSGVAIEGAGFLRNTATGTDSLTINGTAASNIRAINIGAGSSATLNSIAMGANANVTGQDSIGLGYNSTNAGSDSVAIGRDAAISINGSESVVVGHNASSTYDYSIAIGSRAKCTSTYAMQIGVGTNSMASTLSIGFGANRNYQLLDGTTGLIPDARINTAMIATNAALSATKFTDIALIAGSGNTYVSHVDGVVVFVCNVGTSTWAQLSSIDYTDTNQILTGGVNVSGLFYLMMPVYKGQKYKVNYDNTIGAVILFREISYEGGTVS